MVATKSRPFHGESFFSAPFPWLLLRSASSGSFLFSCPCHKGEVYRGSRQTPASPGPESLPSLPGGFTFGPFHVCRHLGNFSCSLTRTIVTHENPGPSFHSKPTFHRWCGVPLVRPGVHFPLEAHVDLKGCKFQHGQDIIDLHRLQKTFGSDPFPEFRRVRRGDFPGSFSGT